ncbi:spore germination protein [Mesobacillus foraminis]|jgi:spore germination protein PF|uniref:Spore germination protein PF n=1 Tax=Mesobacillus foraminis TaxID=279826 RepID=A0A4R2BL06_9BACI|nr:spore germination protein [Mesobacillus foraminis]TCN27937.1 spore germination protein PF [Mesobacillus foraminis]
MPAIIGPVQIVNVGGGTVQFGDTLFISPKSNTKSTTGAGSSNTGGFIITNNGLSSSNVLDSSLVDQPTVGNN